MPVVIGKFYVQVVKLFQERIEESVHAIADSRQHQRQPGIVSANVVYVVPTDLNLVDEKRHGDAFQPAQQPPGAVRFQTEIMIVAAGKQTSRLDVLFSHLTQEHIRVGKFSGMIGQQHPDRVQTFYAFDFRRQSRVAVCRIVLQTLCVIDRGFGYAEAVHYGEQLPHILRKARLGCDRSAQHAVRVE